MRKLPYKPRLRASERRTLIEDAAARLFAERGYSDTSLEDVASAVGVSRPVIYDHFATKRALHEALVRRHVSALVAHVAARVRDEPADPEQRLRAGFSAFFEYVESDRYAWRIVFREPLSEGSAAVADPTIQSGVTAGIAELLQQTADEAKLELGPPERVTRFAEAMRWMCNGLATWWYEHPEVTRDELVQTAMDLSWSGLGRIARAADAVRGS